MVKCVALQKEKYGVLRCEKGRARYLQRCVFAGDMVAVQDVKIKYIVMCFGCFRPVFLVESMSFGWEMYSMLMCWKGTVCH